MYSSTLRPNMRLGLYPERRDEQSDWAGQLVNRLSASLPRVRKNRRAQTRSVCGLIHRHADTYTAMSAAQLSAAVAELRVRLVSKAHSDELIAESFALIREHAQRVLQMAHFDCQLMGGWAIFHGQLAEMQTGEGKTLTASLPAATAALAGVPVHVVTVNDYLATRDAALMQPLYEALDLTVGVITEAASPQERREAYAADITYCTNKQLVFDYLKDRLVLGRGNGRIQLQVDRLDHENTRQQELLLRGLCFAIVDEADSVLIDEARTPLVLSRAADGNDEKQLFNDGLSIVGQLRESVDFTIDSTRQQITITEQGDANIDHLATPLGGVWASGRRRRELLEFGLKARHLFVRDKHYLVRDDKIEIIDEYTGRVMPDRSWSRGLHQMVQAKEGVTVYGRNETLIKITYQRFFRRYLLLGGMSGTAREVAGELDATYGLKVAPIATNLPSRRRRNPEAVYVHQSEKWRAVIAEVVAVHASSRPILIGTRTVSDSEKLGERLRAAGIDVAVLNARQDAEEASIVARAGQLGSVTVATNIAGRGTDIALGEGVAEIGGLHVILCERFDAARIDRQLDGRCARQGDPGSVSAILSIEDEMVAARYPSWLRRVVEFLASGDRALPRWAGALPIRLAQRSVERHHARARAHLFKQDREQQVRLAFTGAKG